MASAWAVVWADSWPRKSSIWAIRAVTTASLDGKASGAFSAMFGVTSGTGWAGRADTSTNQAGPYGVFRRSAG